MPQRRGPCTCTCRSRTRASALGSSVKLGKAREARHWYHQLMESTSESAPPDATFIEGLEIFARYIRVSGNGASAPTGRLESEVDRLASSRTGTGGIVRRPDRRLVDQLHEFADRS